MSSDNSGSSQSGSAHQPSGGFWKFDSQWLLTVAGAAFADAWVFSIRGATGSSNRMLLSGVGIVGGVTASASQC